MYVAFASHGRRLELCGENLKSLMYPKQTMEAERYILTIYKDDVNRLLKNKRLMKYVEDGKLDVILAPVNLKTCNKWYWAMQMYDNLPFYTIDDDCVYLSHTLENLYDSFVKYPDCVISTRGREMHYSNLRSTRNATNVAIGPSTDIVSWGGDGVLFPPRFKECITWWYDIIKNNEALMMNDDILLHWIRNKAGIQTVIRPGQDAGMVTLHDIESINPSWEVNDRKRLKTQAIKILQNMLYIA